MGDPQLRDYKLVGGLETFANRSFWPNFFSKIVARLQWAPESIDMTQDVRAWPELGDERRLRLTTLLAGLVNRSKRTPPLAAITVCDATLSRSVVSST